MIRHPADMLEARDPLEIIENAAGSMQLQPIDKRSRPGAFAALGHATRNAKGVWVARDSVTDLPRAYVALRADGGHAVIHGAAGLDGTCADVAAAADVVRRYADEVLGLITT